jgi:serine/threonine protein phosphatase 1
MRLGEAKTPAGMRLYAIGDVHGRDDLLGEIHEKIADDRATRPPADIRIIHLGDYVDRGPDTAAVIERLVQLKKSEPNALFLRGNHEELLLEFLADPAAGGVNFVSNGGLSTLASYGIDPDRLFDRRDLVEAGKRLADAMQGEHRAFIDTLRLSIRFGDFFFCHAGVRPGIPLAAQSADDLTWIRSPFLEHDGAFEAVIVHGHTPMQAPEVLPNRINIDTGAVFSGRRTCLALEGTAFRFL